MAFDAPSADRRQFMTWSAGGAFLLAAAGPATSQPGRGAPAAGSQSPWYEVHPNGRVTVFSNAVEMGQGSHSGQAAIIADELDMPWNMVDVEMVDIQKYANQIFTGGSTSISGQRYGQIRAAGAEGRARFMQAAAQRWGVGVDQVETANGKVINKATRAEIGYGELAQAAADLPAPVNVALKETSSMTCIGVPQQTKRLRERVTGKEVYGIDVRVPGMLRASVQQAPVFGATLASVDESPATAMPGVVKVVKLEGAVAVIARDTWTAMKAVRALRPQWTLPEQRSSTASISAALREAHAAALAAEPSAEAAPLRAAFASAAKKVEATYELAHVAHVTMEPQNATAHVTDGKVEIWAPTQVPSSVKRGAAAWAGKAGADVVLHTTMLGGGFGRRLTTEYVEQAVRIAAQADAPVQMVWTREEDFTHDNYRRAVMQTYRAALRDDGLIDAYEAISAASDSPVRQSMDKAPYNAIATSVITQAGNRGAVAAGIPQGAWRSVDPGISTWGRESFIDECAHAAGQDPLQYRMKLLGDNARVKAVLQKAADEIGWTNRRPAGTGVGIAVAFGFGTFTAHAIEVEVGRDKTLNVKRIVVASDMGTVVAPNQVRGQFQGGTLMALGTALTEAQTFEGGAAQATNFGPYKVLRQTQAPTVEVHLLESPNEAVGGAGEPPMPTLAPALANAIFAANGERVRALPIEKAGYKV